MNYDFKQTLLSRSIFSGLLAGFAAVILNFIWDVAFRGITGFAPSEIINIPFLIFSSLGVALVGGILFYALSAINKGKGIFMILFLMLTVVGVYIASQTHRTNIPANQHDFRWLFAGVIIIDGLCTAFLIPYFVTHRKIYS